MSLLFKFFKICIYYWKCVCEHTTCECTWYNAWCIWIENVYAKVRQLCGAISLLLPWCGFCVLNSGYQASIARWQVSLHTKSSCWPLFLFFLLSLKRNKSCKISKIRVAINKTPEYETFYKIFLFMCIWGVCVCVMLCAQESRRVLDPLELE